MANGRNMVNLALQAWHDKAMASIHVAELAKVANVSQIDNGLIDVTPLAATGKGRPTINSCYITQQAKYVPTQLNGDQLSFRKLKVGDVVSIAFLDFDSDNFNGGTFKVGSNRVHSINDVIVLGVV